jgi:hypothetical protein
VNRLAIHQRLPHDISVFEPLEVNCPNCRTRLRHHESLFSADDGGIVMELLMLLSHCAASGIGSASRAGPRGDFDDVDDR